MAICTGAQTHIAPAEAAFLLGKSPPVDYAGMLPAENGSGQEFSFRLLQCSIAADQVVCRTVVFEPGCCLALQFGNDALGEHLAQLDTPLVKRINVPNHALREDAVFVKRNELAKNFRREPVGQNDI